MFLQICLFILECFDIKIDDDLEYRSLMETKDYFNTIKYINLYIQQKFFNFLDMGLIENMKKKRDFHINLEAIFIKHLYPNLYKFNNSIFIRSVPGFLQKFNNINDKLQLPLIEKCVPDRHDNNKKKYRMKWGNKIKIQVIHSEDSCVCHNSIVRKVGVRYIMEKLEFIKLSNTDDYEILLLGNII